MLGDVNPPPTRQSIDYSFDLNVVFNGINDDHFGGKLIPPRLVWNSRLRASAGRFIPGYLPGHQKSLVQPCVIEVATYLQSERRAEYLIWDTMGHEMIHYWLYAEGKPYGHTPEFKRKMRAIGVSRYNTVPKVSPYKYIYQCPVCVRKFPARKKLGHLACKDCCAQYNGGRYHRRFVIEFAGEFRR